MAAAPSATPFTLLRVLAVICFTLLLLLSAHAHDMPRSVTDEQAQLSYILQLRDGGFHWPALEDLRLYNLATRQPTATPNYLNHPATAYYVPALLLSLWPQMPLQYLRYVGATIGLVTFLTYLAIGTRLNLSRGAYALYAFFPCLAYLAAVAATVNIDAAPMLGGCLLVLGWLRWQARQCAGRLLLVFGWLLMGMKFNSLLIAATYIPALLLCTPVLWPRWKSLWPLGVAAILSALPYSWFLWRYGSPAPMTPGQSLLLQQLAATDHSPQGWSFLHYSVQALLAFPRYHIASSLFLHFYQALFALLALAMAHALWRDRSAYRPLGVATVLSFAGVFAIQLVYCYGRYRHFGWFGDFYPRYYIGLMPGFGYLFMRLLPVRNINHSAEQH